MKRLIASLLFVLSLCIALFAASAYAEDSDFQINKSGVLTKYLGSGGDVVIPDGVTSIGDRAFWNCTGLTSVTIPDSVTEIGDYAFGNCTGLTNVYISDLKAYIEINFASIYSNPTCYAENLYLNGELLTGDIVIPDGVTKIPNYMFQNNKNITSVTIPESVTSIGDYAFWNCTGLTSVTIPGSVTSIGDRAFYGCTSLTSVTIPGSVTEIGGSAFGSCYSLTSIDVDSGNQNYSSIDGNLYNKAQTKLIQYAVGKKDKSFPIPESVTSIGDSAFYGCSSLTSVTIPGSVTSIGDRTFADCTGLTNVTIPDSVTSIGWGAFYRCKKLSSITIPKSVVSMGDDMFGWCTSLVSIDVDPDNQNYSSIDGNLYDKAQTELIQYAIGKKDKSFSIPQGVSTIGREAFYGCSNLTSITIPGSVTSIGYRAFYGCTGLTGIDVGESNKRYSSIDGNLYNKTQTKLIQYAVGKKDQSFSLPGSVTSIGDNAFYGCTSLTSVTIPGSVTSIGDYAFYGCTSLTSVTIPGSVTSIGDYTFYGCTSLTSVTIPGSVTSIGDYAFRNCNNLTSVTIPDSVTSIGSYAFAYCHNLTTISFMGDAPEFDVSAIPDSSTLTAYYPVGKRESFAAAMEQFPNVKWRVQGGGCEHNWGAWKITKSPTQTENGLAERICTFDSSHKETVILPALTDASVWTKGAYVAPTCGKEGSQEYTSIYGAVTETLSVTEHSWGAWRITQNPTQTETGKAERSCKSDSTHKDIKELPALTDSTVWTKGAYVAPTNDKNGSQEYTSVYGAVIEAIPALGHKFTVLQHDETKHWYKCEDCDATFNEENHRGGQATKKEKATCSVCNAQYGKLLPDYALPADLKTTYGKALSDITLPTGWKWSDPSIVPTVTNNGYEAYYAIENDADYDWTNENGYDAAAKQIKLTLTVTVEKEKQKLSFEKSSINKYTTDSAFTNELTKTAVFGAVSFSSSDESVATVDNNGLITIKGTGTTDITASAAETETHSAASATFTLKVSKKDSGGGGGGGGGGSRGSSISVAPGGAKKDDTQSSNQTEQTGSGSPFSDVQKSDWFYEPMKFVYSNGLMKGVSDNEFDPNGAASRAMLVTVLYRMEKEPQAQASPFSDIAGGSYYEKAVAWANANGIVKGVSDAEFAPDESITREQMAAMIYRYAAYKKMDLSAGESTNILSYADYSDISDYAVSAMRYAAGSGIINGMTADTLSPKGISTRAQAAAVFMRVFNLFNK